MLRGFFIGATLSVLLYAPFYIEPAPDRKDARDMLGTYVALEEWGCNVLDNSQ